ncbi:MAG: hypothetical protein QJR05_11995, partial [Thermoanaerobacterium sp.]|nr:hypothetical protein [Thermoanaerobacterium sp.]
MNKNNFSLEETWKRYIASGNIHGLDLDPLIHKSWSRCLEKKIEPNSINRDHVISQVGLRERTEKNTFLLQATHFAVEKFYSFLKGSNSVLFLVDADGYILYMIGDSMIITETKRVNLIKGANWREDV